MEKMQVAEEMKTDWFPVEKSPVYDGDYEYQMEGFASDLREYRGGYWRRSNGQPLLIRKGDRWRGVKSPVTK